MKLFTALNALSAVFLSFNSVPALGSISGREVPAIHTTSGHFQGFSPFPSVHAYLGIPFAKSPVGALRFEPPQPFVSNSSTAVDATGPIKGCYQVLFNTALNDKLFPVGESEDCLVINVWKNASATTKTLRPVMVWLYGGGFAQGSSMPSDGTHFVSEQEDIIFVSFNYRINIFGFPISPAIQQSNVGLLDQRLAIEWIRDNIGGFGGDPSRITLIGQSAGSISIAYYAFAYPNDPIVSGLIELSGQPESSFPDDGSSWKKVADFTGCNNNTSPEEELVCLKRQPAREIRRGISLSRFLDYGDLTGGAPVADNITVFTESGYMQRGFSGQFAKIPLWASHALQEGDNLVDFNTSSAQGINYTISDYITLAVFHCPTALATAYRVTTGIPVYRSVYSGTFPSINPYPWMRAFHGADTLLLFDAPAELAWQDPGPPSLTAGRYFRDAVAAFVRDPKDGLKNFGWPRYDATGNTLVNLFANDTTTAAFENVKQFDAACQSLMGQ